MQAVFDIKPGSRYDDERANRYHFPARSAYLAAARAAIGDWIVYREPQRNRGRRAYVAVARVTCVEVDPERAGFHYAYVDSYMDLPSPVSFAGPNGYAEAALRAIGDPRHVGRTLQGKSIRQIDHPDFLAIASSGFGIVLQDMQDLAEHLRPSLLSIDEAGAVTRRVDQVLLNRIFREASFRHEVRSAYANTCAVTGLDMVDWRGNPEVNAAHLMAVADGGPDIVQNGIALTATVHWLFDRHCISIDEQFRLLLDEQLVPPRVRGLLLPATRGLKLPIDKRIWPSQKFLASHRAIFEIIKKGTSMSPRD